MSRNKKVMIVDDDGNIAELIALYLNKEGYDTRKYYNASSALEDFSKYAPDLVILDIMLPGMDGYDVCKEMRKSSNIPIIMVTAKGETFDKVLGLELGADDYIVKPFDAKELIARVKAVLRRYQGNGEDGGRRRMVYPNLSIDLSDYTLIYHGKKLEIPPKESELLYFLASTPNRVYTREQILDQVWGYDFVGESRTVDVHIKRLREKLNKEDPWNIKTVWGVGYKFEIL